MKYFLFIFFIIVMTGCAATRNYAPVRSYLRDLSPGDKYYVVEKGDTLYSIGFRSRLGFKKLAAWNKIRSPYVLRVGQKVKLFKPRLVAGRTKRAKANRKIYKKRRGSSHKKIIKHKKKRYTSQKKSANSTDNKKVLKLFWQWPIEKKILKSFSQTGRKGIDISGRVGQKVRAAAAGKVVYTGSSLKGYGNLMIVKHNDLYLSAYANNRKLLVKEGKWVKKGQVIAEVGLVKGKRASLHFEIRKNGKPVNPLSYLPR